MTLPKLYTSTELAEALGQSTLYVRRRCAAGEWPHRRLAQGTLAFTRADYDAILDLTYRPAAQTDLPGPTPRSAAHLSKVRAS